MVLGEKRPVWSMGVGWTGALAGPLPLQFLGEKGITQAFRVGTWLGWAGRRQQGVQPEPEPEPEPEPGL